MYQFNSPKFRRWLLFIPLTGLCLFLSGCIGPGDAGQLSELPEAPIGAIILRVIRLLALLIAIYQIFQHMRGQIPLIGASEESEQTTNQLLVWSGGLAALILGSVGIEWIMYGTLAPWILLAVCTPPFWIAVVIIMLLAALFASSEQIAISVHSTTGGPPVMSTIGPTQPLTLDLVVATGTSHKSHAPTTPTIVVGVRAGPSVTNFVPVATGVPAGTPVIPGVANFSGTIQSTLVSPTASEVRITVTATCAKGHTKTQECIPSEHMGPISLNF
jgi:hypothetical protein